MHRKIAAFSLMAVLGAAAGSAQEIRTAPKEITAPDYNTVNCSGFVTDQKFPQEFRVISGEQSNYKLTFTSGDHVYINHGQDNGCASVIAFSWYGPTTTPVTFPGSSGKTS